MVQLLTLATVILGVLLLLPLLALSRKHPANVWLGLFVYAITSLALSDYFLMTGVYLREPWLWGLFDWPVAAIGAFFYCYVRSLLGLANSWRQSVHFLPALLLIAMLLPVQLVLPQLDFSTLINRYPVQGLTPLLLLCQGAAACYAVAVWYRLRQYRTRLRQHYSSTRQRDLVWLQWLTLAVVLLLIIWFPAAQAGGPWMLMLVLGRLGLLYAFGWYGLRQQQVFLPPLPEPAPPLTTEDSGTSVLPDGAELQQSPARNLVMASPSTARYARSGMTAAATHLIGERLTKRMGHHRDYLENDLTLTELAQRIGTSPQLLSEYLNVAQQQNFFDYINSQRVAQVQRQLINALATGSTGNLLSVALAAGFNSKSTFNAAFRKHSGMTPSAWRALHGTQK
jgi:AraC-like DNA-binding protein